MAVEDRIDVSVPIGHAPIVIHVDDRTRNLLNQLPHNAMSHSNSQMQGSLPHGMQQGGSLSGQQGIPQSAMQQQQMHNSSSQQFGGKPMYQQAKPGQMPMSLQKQYSQPGLKAIQPMPASMSSHSLNRDSMRESNQSTGSQGLLMSQGASLGVTMNPVIGAVTMQGVTQPCMIFYWLT